MTTLLTKPEIFTVAATSINVPELEDWMNHNELESVGRDVTTPLSEIVFDNGDDLDRLVEFGGRHCYRSWTRGRSRDEYISNLLDMEHGSVFEHASISFAIQAVSRSLTHELVRHRVGVGISQESQRYVRADQVNFVVPPLLMFLSGGGVAHHPLITKFHADCLASLDAYSETLEAIQKAFGLTQESGESKRQTLQRKRALEAARALLPNAAETRLLWTVNLRTLRQVLLLRGGEGADLEIRRLAVGMFTYLTTVGPGTRVLRGIEVTEGDFGVPILVDHR